MEFPFSSRSPPLSSLTLACRGPPASIKLSSFTTCRCEEVFPQHCRLLPIHKSGSIASSMPSTGCVTQCGGPSMALRGWRRTMDQLKPAQRMPD